MSSPKNGGIVKSLSEFLDKPAGKVAVGLGLAAAAFGGYKLYQHYTTQGAPSDSGATELKSFLVKDAEPREVTLLQKIVQNHDSFIFRFALPDGHVLGVPTGYHILIHLPTEGGEVKGKPYTPISLPSQQKHFDLLVKVYRADGDKKAGNHTSQLEALKEGDKIRISGPVGKHEYKGHGVFNLPKDDAREDKKFSHISFVAGGSGITPFLSILNKVKSLKNDNTLLTLIYSNKTEADTLHQRELEEAEKQVKFKAVFTVTRQNEVSSERFSTGRVTGEFLKKHLPAPAADHLVLHCGPQGFNAAVAEQLEELGHTALKF